MLSGWVIFVSAFAYVLLLFAVASYGDRRSRVFGVPKNGRPVVYALSLAIYCTSWTYFGGVGLASQKGLEFTGIYIGPILAFTLGMPLLRRIIDLAKAEKLTSVADFVAARYGKNSTVAMIVAVIALVGAIPYIALQLKAVSSSVTAMVNPSDYGIGSGNLYFLDLPLIVTLMMACFAVIFGTRHTDATEHQDGLILAVAMESVVKLLAFVTVGFSVFFIMFDGPSDLFEKASQNMLVGSALAYETPLSRWVILTILSAFAIILLPRQFHVTVVENRTAKERRVAGALLPLYLIAINIFVLPVALAGLIKFGGVGDADIYVLTLPLAEELKVVSLIAFIGGFSAATAMVIVESVALSIMVSNDIIIPIFLRQRLMAARSGQRNDFTRTLLHIRRVAIFGVLMLGYAYYRMADSQSGLASIGLLAFAAIAQVAPALLGGLIWRRANARGAILGMSFGFIAWAYMLFVPSLGGPDNSHVAAAVLNFLFPGTGIFSGPHTDPLVNATIFSLTLNIIAFVLGSLSRNPRPVERIQAGIFVKRHLRSQFATRGWKTRVAVGDLKAAIARYLGEERMRRSFSNYERTAGRTFSDEQPADMAMIHFSEQLLGSAIGSSSARLVLSLIMQKAEDTSADTAWLLDQASEALQYNQDMLQSALSQMDQGIAVFDSSERLTIWNRRFRNLLNLPEQVGQVGYPLSDIVGILADRGDIADADHAAVVRQFHTLDAPFSLVLHGGERIIEVRSNAMPDRGIVATFTDISERVAADMALKQANETLEQRVGERTAELTRVNRELAEAQASADEANIGKTRFFAAAGHDILQPLNAARLYSSALVERLGASDNNSALVSNIDSALESVEAILGAVLDISRLDTGAMKPRLSSVPLNDLLKRIETDYAPMAREKDLKFVVMPTSLTVRSDANLLRRLVQNLVSNAIKYTIDGKVLVGARRKGDQVVIEVFDSGIGIPPSKFRTVFKEFARLDEGAKTAAGLGLGLSIVDRISRVLNHPVQLNSAPGRGTRFKVQMPLDLSLPQSARTTGEPERRKRSQPLNGLRVLCVDNEPRILEGMAVLIGGWGCTVTQADSIAAIDGIAGREPLPEIVIADYHLDDGNGIEAILKLRQKYQSHIPALIITADRTPEVRAEAERHDIGVQHKPVKPAAMRAYLTQVAGLKRVAAE
ncbi:PAS-domain containing protein [Rhizobium sp. XQZ8]|uniref:PAS domain-containing hybrid sensor histidine kinase/response regulator n=1 Tax=Rhizobium populisoli TaxID=2859785 RepID=UPI001CA5AFD3|nr:NahK/ErcS family hybrid sensor histidine kinase/response regulator [Rhizobium populisoli]MBW6425910.1 PAS-domain containing protein [Rhizobium populisoli]